MNLALRLTLLIVCFTTVVRAAAASPAQVGNPNTDWLRTAGLGVFMHFLPGDPASFEKTKQFDVEALAEQLQTAGARYFVITLGQNSGYFISPNATYERMAGYKSGECCSSRDLPMEIHAALQKRGIRLMLYLPCQVPNQDRKAQAAFGLEQGPRDQPIDVAFARKWAEVIHEWSARYGDKVSGWWFDGGYTHIRFNDAIADIYATAVKSGNPKAIVTFNPGVKLVRHTKAEDYTAGELNEPFGFVPAARWVEGSQWHALTYLGSNWGKRDTRYPAERWASWVSEVVRKGGAVTLDMGPNWDPAAGPIGSLDKMQLEQLRAASKVLPKSANAANSKPNVIILYPDQWRAQAFGFAGDPNVKTPQLDRLARQSVRFVNAVAGVPVCCPSRAAFMTGRSPLSTGVFMNDVPLDPKATTLGDIFQAEGYKTAYIGKWHVDGHGRSNFIPRERRHGFEYWKVLECTHNYNGSYYYSDSPEKLKWEGYDALAQTRDAVDYIRARAGDKSPFVLMLAWGPPHDPYQTAPDKFRKMYSAESIGAKAKRPCGKRGCHPDDVGRVLRALLGAGRMRGNGDECASGDRAGREHIPAVHIRSRRPPGKSRRSQ